MEIYVTDFLSDGPVEALPVSRGKQAELTAITLVFGIMAMLKDLVFDATDQEREEIREGCKRVQSVVEIALYDEAFKEKLPDAYVWSLQRYTDRYIEKAYPDKGKIPARALTSACLLHLDDVAKALEAAELKRPGRNRARKRKLDLLGMILRELLHLDHVMLAQDNDDALGLLQAERAGEVLREIAG